MMMIFMVVVGIGDGDGDGDEDGVEQGRKVGLSIRRQEDGNEGQGMEFFSRYLQL